MRLIRTGEVVGQEIRAGGAGGRAVPVLRTLMAATVMVMSLGAGVARAEDVSQVEGALLFAGGELRFGNAPVWKQFVKLAGGKGAPVVVMPTAADNPRKSGQATVENLKRYGARAEMVLIAPMLKGIPCKAAATDEANVKKLRQARGIWFIGGEQQSITKALLNEDGNKTPALQAIWDAYRKGAVIGGTSAGTAIMSKWMFADAMNSLDTIKHGITRGTHVAPGLGFIGDDWLVEQHCLTRGRFARALNAMRDFKFKYGIGVDEDTAVVFKGGKFKVIGYKGALVYVDISPVRLAQPLARPLAAAGDQPPPVPKNGDGNRPRTVLVIHGGAGVLNEDEMKKEKLESGKPLKRNHYEEALARALKAGYEAWRQNKETAHVDAVEAAIRVMEDSELFNAGHGAALNHDGRAELDAAIMEGKMGDWKKGDPEGEGKKDPRKRAGAVAAVWHIKNPISAARAVMEMPGQRAALLVGEGAESFVFSEETMKRYPGKLERVSNAYFWTERRLRDIRREIQGDEKRGRKAGRRPQGEGGRRDRYLGTVGAVARKGTKLAAGTSTGGLTNKLPGRVGDTPLPGAGTYADDRACGVSCTGTGEVFIRHAVAHDVVARMLYGKAKVGEAAREAIAQLPDEKDGVGGLIALDKDGNHAFPMSKESVGMYRGYVTEEGEIYVAIYRADKWRPMGKGGKDGKGEK